MTLISQFCFVKLKKIMTSIADALILNINQFKTKNKMDTIEKCTLIEGDFNFYEAKEVLNSLFSYKINYHKIKNWSAQERFGIDDDMAQKRIGALRDEMKKIEKILAEARHKKLLIHSEIHISIIED